MSNKKSDSVTRIYFKDIPANFIVIQFEMLQL